jgi:hypothetical protein
MVLLPAVLSHAEPTEERGAPELSSHPLHRAILRGAGLLHAPHGDLAGSVSLRGGIVDVPTVPSAVSRPMCADVRAHPFPRANSEATGCLAWTNKSPFGTGGKRRGR